MFFAPFAILTMPTSTITYAMALKFLLTLSNCYKGNSLKEFWIGPKLTEQWVIIWVAVTLIDLKLSINKCSFWLLVTLTWKSTDAIGMNFFQTLSFYYTCN